MFESRFYFYSNEFIRTGNISENYFPGNSVFQHCNMVDFREIKTSFFRGKRETIVANDPLSWFRFLKERNCKHLQLYYKPAEKNEFGPEYNLAGFIGGAGTWLIETNFGEYSHYWQKMWNATNKNAPDNRIWSVNYVSYAKKMRPEDQRADVTESKKKLEETIKELVAFCTRPNLQDWLHVFQKADDALHNAHPEKLYYNDDLIVLKNYPLQAQQLLFGAAISWVFGGMGWWNDIGFDDKNVEEKYLDLSQRLYEQILQAIIAVSNSF